MQNVHHSVQVLPWNEQSDLQDMRLLQVHGGNHQKWHQHLQAIEVPHPALAAEVCLVLGCSASLGRWFYTYPSISALVAGTVRPWKNLGADVRSSFWINEMTVWNVHSSWCWLGNLRPWTCKLPWSRTCCCCWTHVAIFDSCILQDVIESFALRGDFLPELRDDRQHSFFKGLDVADTTSVQALEANQEFLMEMCATLAPELAIAPHYAWKARWYIICKSKISQFCLHVCVQAAFKVLADRYGIFPQKTRKKTIKVGESICSDVIHEFFLWQEWAGIQAGYARQMTMHALDLTNRSQGSRCFLGVCFFLFFRLFI